MRRKVDANHSAVVAALRKIGCSVQSIASVGGGCPDLLVGLHAVNVLMEVKDGAKKPSDRKLTPDEEKWHAQWNGQVAIVQSPEEAIAVMMILTRFV